MHPVLREDALRPYLALRPHPLDYLSKLRPLRPHSLRQLDRRHREPSRERLRELEELELCHQKPPLKREEMEADLY